MKTQDVDGRPGDGRHEGQVARVFARGFGFIRCAQLDPDDKGIYFHASDLQERGAFAELRAGATVEFGVMEDDRGLRATEVEVLVQGTGAAPIPDKPRAGAGPGGRGAGAAERRPWASGRPGKERRRG